MLPKNWLRYSTEDQPDTLKTSFDNADEYAEVAESMNKPLVSSESGFPCKMERHSKPEAVEH